jgi:LacI family transcriptional regulator
MARKRVTLADVAARSGMSIAAASMILNGRPDTRLSQDAHDRVHAAARELGYRPNVAARGLRTAKTHTIGFVSDVVATTRFASGLIRGALAAAEAAGHVVLVAETGGESAREAEAIEALLDRQVDGIIFATMRAREVFLPELPDGTPAVMLNATNTRYPRSNCSRRQATGMASCLSARTTRSNATSSARPRWPGGSPASGGRWPSMVSSSRARSRSGSGSPRTATTLCLACSTTASYRGPSCA